MGRWPTHAPRPPPPPPPPPALQRLASEIRDAIREGRYPEYVRQYVARHFPAGDVPEWVALGCRLAGIELPGGGGDEAAAEEQQQQQGQGEGEGEASAAAGEAGEGL